MGEPGPRGEQGFQGRRGLKGIKGLPGPKGPDGEVGDKVKGVSTYIHIQVYVHRFCVGSIRVHRRNRK